MSLIVIDSSAVVAILLNEPEAGRYVEAIGTGECCMSAVSVYETEIVMIGRHGPAVSKQVRALLARANVRIVPFDEEQSSAATAAYVRFGKGHHPARLNMGDCAAYALARSLDAPLLYKGDDFARTDVAAAVTPG
ncbi:PIN domain-containing protein [Rhizobium sp. CRIBSB]|nr:PIN domain-containing protein [Rhizobium sp. CRIBSB]